MRVIAANRTSATMRATSSLVRGLDALEAVLAEADYVVLACALTPETTGLIGAAALCGDEAQRGHRQRGSRAGDRRGGTLDGAVSSAASAAR
jgi:hypothetical protein